MSADVTIANFLRIAQQDLDGAKTLASTHNRNAIYLCEQAAEKMRTKTSVLATYSIADDGAAPVLDVLSRLGSELDDVREATTSAGRSRGARSPASSRDHDDRRVGYRRRDRRRRSAPALPLLVAYAYASLGIAHALAVFPEPAAAAKMMAIHIRRH